MAAYFDVKLDFARRMPKGAPYVVCLDGGYGQEMLAACRAIEGLNVIPVTLREPSFDLSGLQLVGDYNKSNVLVAAALAEAAGVSHEEIQRIIPTLMPRWGRLEYVPCASRAKVYVDFAHTPDGLEKVLAAARGFTTGKLWVVFGAGGDRDPMKRPLMGAACEDPEKIIAAILDGIPADRRSVVRVEPDRHKAINAALALAEADDVVLVCGKGHETTQEIAGVKYPFDDREVVRAFR